MQNNFKKTMLYIVIAAVAWLPVQVAFAASFVMPASAPVQMSATNPSSSVAAKQSGPRMQDQAMEDMNMAHCDMHKKVKECCQSDTACNMSDQECSKCLSFVAMSYLHQLPQFAIQYQTQYNFYQPLIGTSHFLDIRPPKTTLL